jgi:uncharacterized protein YkwD
MPPDEGLYSVTRPVRCATAAIALFTAALGATLALSAPAGAATSSPTTLENQVATLINQQRGTAKCHALVTNEKLRVAARRHSADMASHKMFSHVGTNGSTFVTREAEAGYSQAMAENIAWGWRTPAELVNAWMNSPAHRTNILNCAAKSVGVGVGYGSDGTPYWTQDFGRS